MTTLITIGNLTRDAEVKRTKDGRNYVLLQIADNVYKKDEKGNKIKNAEGHFETLETRYFSVFVHEKAGALTVSSLQKGHAVKVIGNPKIVIVKDSDGYEKNVIDSISAYSVDADPFNNLSDTAVSSDEIPM